ncbi:MAG: LPS ABC transporter substrate-binding protein LptA [Proteobacteria bacterium]|nr:LPS ABC transporter substrate-binding protein LptA [Pseudomonadota bacterium]MBU1611938.1 LPS ABC transporter substrate-binding protein LptA [Pseudomonadota bacterium]
MRIFYWMFGVLVALMFLPQAGWAWGEIRVATNNLNVRAARRVDAPKILTLVDGQQIKVDFMSGNWCAIFPLDAVERDETKAIGYANVRFLKFVSKAPEVGGEAQSIPIQPAPVPAVPAPVAPVSVQPEPMAPAAPAASMEQNTDGMQDHVVERGEGTVMAKVKEHMDEVERERSAKAEDPPVKITADRMVYNEAKRTVVFEGSVQADHAGLVLTSETLTAFFKSGGKSTGAEQIDRIVAKGNVTVNRKTTEGRCATLTYMVADGMLLMEGNPVIKDGDNTITGQLIKFYMKDNRSEVVGGKNKRVQAVFTAPGKLEP